MFPTPPKKRICLYAPHGKSSAGAPDSMHQRFWAVSAPIDIARKRFIDDVMTSLHSPKHSDMSSAPLTPSSVPNDVGQSLHDSCHSTFWYVSGPHGTHTLFGISVNVPGGHFTAKTKFRCTYVVLSSSLRVCADQELAWHMQLEFNCDVMSGHDVCACLRLRQSSSL